MDFVSFVVFIFCRKYNTTNNAPSTFPSHRISTRSGGFRPSGLGVPSGFGLSLRRNAISYRGPTLNSPERKSTATRATVKRQQQEQQSTDSKAGRRANRQNKSGNRQTTAQEQPPPIPTAAFDVLKRKASSLSCLSHKKKTNSHPRHRPPGHRCRSSLLPCRSQQEGILRPIPRSRHPRCSFSTERKKKTSAEVGGKRRPPVGWLIRRKNRSFRTAVVVACSSIEFGHPRCHSILSM